MSNKICNIDSGNIVNGSKLFYNSTLAIWNSPLDKLERGYEMFAYSQLGDFRTFDGMEAGPYGCYTEFASLSEGHRMFSHTSPRFYGGRVAFPELLTGTQMFQDANIGAGDNGGITGRLTVHVPKLKDAINMFYCAKADAVYLHLATNSNDVNLSYGFAGVQTNCGIEVQYAQAISSGANMFQNVTSELINLGYIPGSGYCNCASMFEGATVEDGIFITDLSKLSYSYSYYATKSIGQEDFFTNLFNIWRITDATNMFKGLRITNTQYNTIDGRFPIREVSNNFLDSNGGGASLTSCSSMFMGTRCFGDIKITKDIFVGGQMTSGFSADHMFYDAIPTNPQKTSGHYVHIGSHAFHYCNNASDMFSGNTGLREVRLIGRETLCNEKTKSFFGKYPNGDRMFDGCTNLSVFYTTTSNNSNLEVGYHKVSSGENCFSGCKLDNLGSLQCAYNFLSECAVSTIGISKEWAESSYGVSIMENVFNVSYPTLSISHNGGRIIYFEYN